MKNQVLSSGGANAVFVLATIAALSVTAGSSLTQGAEDLEERVLLQQLSRQWWSRLPADTVWSTVGSKAHLAVVGKSIYFILQNSLTHGYALHLSNIQATIEKVQVA